MRLSPCRKRVRARMVETAVRMTPSGPVPVSPTTVGGTDAPTDVLPRSCTTAPELCHRFRTSPTGSSKCSSLPVRRP
jgi:hypothetical protein